MAQAMASMAGLRGSSQAVLEGSLQSNRLTTGNTGRTAVARTGFTVRAQKQSSGETETSRRAMLGLVAAGIASGSFVQAVLAEAKPIKVGPPPPPSGGLPGTLNSDEARDFDLPLKKRFYLQATKSKWTILVLSILLLFPSATSQPTCGLSGQTFANNSTYEANLNALIASLSSNISSGGFLNASVGQSPDRVNAIVLCRGDISLPACRQCVSATAPATVQRCPNTKDAIFWNETCMVRYSSQPIFRKLETQPFSQIPSRDGAPNPQRHDQELTALLESLRGYAANGGSFKKVAAGIRTAPDVQPIYALEQCTPDLSATDCTECLTRAIDDIPTCCSGIIGAGVLRPSCTLRFENYRFYSASMVEVPQEPFTEKKGSHTTVIIIIVVISGVTLLFVACVVFFVTKRMKRKTEYIPQATEEISTVESLQYDFGKIRDATNDFADPNKLGEGGFGAVYHGSLPTGEEIAVKRLSKDSGQGIAEFKNEVLLMAKLQHRNLVRLLGFSTEGTERLLIYEFVQNASLDKFIFDPIRRSQLDWDKRYKIIGGVAKGLLYLHEDSRLKIIHRDLKASNILLDGDMNPKIADFGMARLFGQDETQRNTSKIVGTYGYMSPEYAMYGQFSIKSDVFSFGVLVMEIITGRRNIYIQSEENVQDLLTIAWKNWEEGTPEKVIDPIILLKNGMSEIVRCFHMGLLCVQENAANRPTMASIVLMLSSSTITLPRPSEPAFYMASRFGPVVPEFNSKDYAAAAASQDSSRNHMSITDFYPR